MVVVVVVQGGSESGKVFANFVSFFIKNIFEIASSPER